MSHIQFLNDERRLDLERRQFHYFQYIPERRSGRGRRFLDKRLQTTEPLKVVPNLNFDDKSIPMSPAMCT